VLTLRSGCPINNRDCCFLVESNSQALGMHNRIFDGEKYYVKGFRKGSTDNYGVLDMGRARSAHRDCNGREGRFCMYNGAQLAENTGQAESPDFNLLSPYGVHKYPHTLCVWSTTTEDSSSYGFLLNSRSLSKKTI
jgi:hypothetical protein